MNWYFKTFGIHVRVRVFMNGANCGELCFRKEEFEEIRARALSQGNSIKKFVDETEDASE